MSPREKKWVSKYLHAEKGQNGNYPLQVVLKMRPIGLDCPIERLMEHWLIEEGVKSLPPLKVGESRGNMQVFPIDMVFSSHGPTIAMFRARGVFVFDCNQGE